MAKLGKTDGFLGNPQVKIPLPDGLRQAEGLMRTMGMGKQADELVTAMNRAAESAVAEAKPILVDAVKKMTVQDAKQILTGGDNSVTEYFRRTTSEQLTGKFKPVVTKATSKVKLAEKYDQYAGKGAQFGLVKEQDASEHRTANEGDPVPLHPCALRAATDPVCRAGRRGRRTVWRVPAGTPAVAQPRPRKVR
ncbi:MAG: DUF4197 domain-containing protein [Comamonadaceae bacterium]|nr:DUF4197 domain-containing protein [Comamonadaceae bacterium]